MGSPAWEVSEIHRPPRWSVADVVVVVSDIFIVPEGYGSPLRLGFIV